MAYASFEHNGVNRVGVIDNDRIIPLEGLTEIGRDTPTTLLAAAGRLEGETILLADVTLRPVVPQPGKVFCIGLNYLAHIKESKRDLPTYPVMFPKFASSLIGPYDDILLPPESSQVDYEGELAVIIGETGRRIQEADAARHVLGYSVANDVTMRDYQYKTHQWMQGKSWDRSTPLGPHVVTPAEVEIETAGIRTILNGDVVQESDLTHLIFSIPRLIATVSEFTTLSPGDVILTGTPSGVGFRRDPQVFLRDGDIISVEVDGVGTITNSVALETV